MVTTTQRREVVTWLIGQFPTSTRRALGLIGLSRSRWHYRIRRPNYDDLRVRLRELAAVSGVPAYLVLGPEQISPDWFQGKRAIGVTSGASTPEISVQAVVRRLEELGATSVEEIAGVVEEIEFQLPAAVR